MPNKNRVAYLRITSWKEIVAFANHSFGVLDFRNADLDVSRKLTKKEAADLNKIERLRHENKFRYKEGDKAKAFLSKGAVIDTAVKMFHKHLVPGGAQVLVVGEPYLLGPRFIAAATKKYVALKNKLNKLFKEFDAIENNYDNWEDEDTEEYKLETLEKQWIKLFEEEFEQ